MKEYNQLLADVAGAITKFQDYLARAEQTHRLSLRLGDDRPIRDLREVARLLGMAIEILDVESDAKS